MVDDVPETENVPAVHDAKMASAIDEQADVVLCPTPTVEQVVQDDWPVEAA